MTQRRLPFASRVERYRRQRQWLIDLEHLLDPDRSPPKTSAGVTQSVEAYLADLTTHRASDLEDQAVANHINRIFRSFWWGLFASYDVAGLPRTNNELERYMRRIKTGHRRISGHKNVHDFLIRYGRYAAFVDYQERVDDLLARLSQVKHDDFLRERRSLETALLREQKRHRFRHHQADYLKELEQRWDEAIKGTKS